jgi:hypothetical protein|tara:strand:+ start:161 stop:394 length:234 start_codon:yes stop_codon:yes gene_type:complete
MAREGKHTPTLPAETFWQTRDATFNADVWADMRPTAAIPIVTQQFMAEVIAVEALRHARKTARTALAAATPDAKEGT